MSKSPNLWSYTLPGNWIVLAGKTDTDNDRLSLKIASPNDWWFHVRGMPGSHVILKSKPGEKPSREIRKKAAAIAAFHSKAKNGGVTAVSCTKARFVTRAKGARPGSVNIRKDIVLMVRPSIPSS